MPPAAVARDRQHLPRGWVHDGGTIGFLQQIPRISERICRAAWFLAYEWRQPMSAVPLNLGGLDRLPLQVLQAQDVPIWVCVFKRVERPT